MGYYKSWEGLTALSGRSKGNEKIGVGIRPYGLHAGNLASVVAYPYLFLEKFESSHGESARFTFQVWLTDVEPKIYVGADGRPESADWANMYPGSKTFQLTPAPDGFKGNLTDYWQPAIEGVVRGTIGVRFPHVRLEFHRASELVATPEFEKTIIGCISQATRVKNAIDNWNLRVAEVKGPSSFVWPACPECHEPLIKPRLSRVDGAKLVTMSHKASGHSVTRQKLIAELFWAMQFRMLHATRLAVVQPNIWFMGMDHVPTNMGFLMQDLADIFHIDKYEGEFLHAPLLFADGNKKLSKSLGGAVYISVEKLINALRGNTNAGLDVKYAPLSSDIMAAGRDLLPSYIAGENREQRIAAVEQEWDDYLDSDKPELFRSANATGKVTNKTVAKMLGVPHL